MKKQLGLLDVFAICTGAMISSGLFVLPGIAAAKAGPAVIVAYLLSGLMLIPSMLSMAEMSTALPRAGGDYFFVSRSLGGMFGTIDGVGVWLALLMKTSIALLGLGAYLAFYVHLPMHIIAILAGLVFMVTNMVGAKETMRLQVAMVAVRSVRGLEFPLAKQTIHAVFLLLGSRANPTQHLRFLAAIARRAEDPHFIDNWINAESIDDLPGLLLIKEE